MLVVVAQSLADDVLAVEDFDVALVETPSLTARSPGRRR
jgi:hypothetical protein